MGKERRLEKKIKKLEEAASAGGVANIMADTVVAELNESTSGPIGTATVPLEKVKKPRKKRTKKSDDTLSNPTPPIEGAAEVVESAINQPDTKEVKASELDVSLIASPPHTASTYHGAVSSSDSTTSPLMGATVSNSNAASAPIITPLPAAEPAPSSLPAAEVPISSMPASEVVTMTLERKVEVISDVLYECLTDQLVSIRSLREQIAGLVSEECHKTCDARMRKRPRPAQTGALTPKKRKPTGYQLFCQVKRLERTPAKQPISELGRMWKELTEEERTHYRTEAERSSGLHDLTPGEQLLEGAHDVNDE